jgi:hypothetical protein
MDHPKLFTTAASMLSAAALGAFLMVSGVPRLHAEDADRCQRRVAHAEHDLHKAIEKHGRHSRQADHERRELRQARERCWRQEHRWWDDHERRWRQDHDWDDHDHDRD